MLSTLDAVRRDKSPTVNCCRVLFMTCWHKFRMIFNGGFIASRQTLAVAACRVRCRRCYSPIEENQSNLGVRSQAFCSLSSLQRWKADLIFTRVLLLALSFHRCFSLLFFLSAVSIYLSLGSAVHWTLSPPHFGTRPRLSFLKRFWKITYPTFK